MTEHRCRKCDGLQCDCEREEYDCKGCSDCNYDDLAWMGHEALDPETDQDGNTVYGDEGMGDWIITEPKPGDTWLPTPNQEAKQ